MLAGYLVRWYFPYFTTDKDYNNISFLSFFFSFKVGESDLLLILHEMQPSPYVTTWRSQDDDGQDVSILTHNPSPAINPLPQYNQVTTG